MGLPEHMDALKWQVDYHEMLAVEKTWLPWWNGWGWPLVGLGNDEYLRRTLILGPICIPLWRCRCDECRGLYADLKARVETD